MKRYRTYLTLMLAILLWSGCNRVDESESDFDNVIYLENAKVNNTEKVTFKSNVTQLERTIRAAVALLPEQDLRVQLKEDMSLLDAYNKANDLSTLPLPQENYTLPETETVIPAGNAVSPEVKIQFHDLDKLPRNTDYLLPISAVSSDLGVLSSAGTVYFIVRKGATINFAANTEANYFSFPSITTCDALDGLTAFTFEGLVRPRDLDKNVNSFIGVDGYCLIRFGDAGIAHNQAQFAGPSNVLSNLKLSLKQWQHVAITFDVPNKEMKFYLNGQEVGPSSGTPPAYAGGVVNLGSKLTSSDRFLIGRSYDPDGNGQDRDFIGDMCEVRVWSTVRTAEELIANMYDVDPDSKGLEAYWKMDEGSGSAIKDYSKNKIDGVAKNTLLWTSVALPAEE